MENLQQATIDTVKKLTPEQMQALLLLIESWQNHRAQAAIGSSEAEAIVNGWLLDNLPDRFTAGTAQPITSRHIWYVPIELTYPTTGSIGKVGEALVSAFSGVLLSVSQVEDLQRTAAELYNTRPNELQAPVL
ncbi:hypothetical protein IQ241_16710 [Romeria aff. gracilis LEGE 07310]|uniref:Uncharacterized protein n=1 Tax=Vasconcelosia minhoensis LEGE 07310 TaxID=915328 RepID=A0A8J7AH89_9CYAN|nr:hypothetical protein [Romeria gracilis]MBE9078914.1 hypothetical protein [Romeria aff. gracilis LEGE 07310]